MPTVLSVMPDNLPACPDTGLQAFVAEREVKADHSATEAPPAAAPSKPALCRSSVNYSRSICVAVGHDWCTEKELKYASKFVCKPQDAVTLVHVSPGGAAASKENAHLLDHACAMLLQGGKVRPEQVTATVLPATKHVGQALVAHCLKARPHILVVGCRGLTGMKGKMSSIFSKGSVSRYCTDHLPSSIAVVVVQPPLPH